MNTLFISFDYPPILGGIANVSYETAKNLSTEDEKLIVIAPRVKGYKEFDNKAGLTTFRVTNIKILREIILFFIMLYLIFKFRIEVIYNLTWYPSAAVSYFVSILTGTPYVINVYAMDYLEDRRSILNKLKYNWLRMFVKKLAFDRAKKIIAVSNFTKDMLIVRGIDALKIKIIFPGVDCARFMPLLDAKEIIRKHRLENKKVLLTVSRLEDYKGHDMVIKTLPRIISQFPDIAYLIVGTGPHEKYLRRLVEKSNLNSYVIFTGIVDDTFIPLYYNACDVFIMLSREIPAEAKAEGYGIVFLEANACAKPVIAGRSGGIEDAVIDGVTGILVYPLDSGRIYNAVTKILSDRDYADRLGTNGLGRIKKEKLDWPSAGRRIGALLSEAKG